MDALVVGSYWFANGVFFVLFARRIIETRNNSIGWLLGLCLTVLTGVLLLFGATVCFEHFFEALSLKRGFLFFLLINPLMSFDCLADNL